MVRDDAMNSRMEQVRGTRLVVRLEWEGVLAESPSGGRFVPLESIVEEVLISRDGFPNFVVRLVRPFTLQPEFMVDRMFVIGIDMNLFDELFGTPRRPVGLPVLVGIYRLRNDQAIEKIRVTNRPPPGGEFVGRGEVSLT